MKKSILVTTGNEIPDKKIKEILGVVKGNVVQSRNIVMDFGAGLKNLVGGEIKIYTDMTVKARDVSYERMVKEAEKLGADAIIAMRFSTSTVMQGASEMLAFGTAVRLK